jgi:hypothetical protein
LKSIVNLSVGEYDPTATKRNGAAKSNAAGTVKAYPKI